MVAGGDVLLATAHRRRIMATPNYEDLINKPSINGHELSGSMSLQDLGIVNPQTATNSEIDEALGWS